MTRNTTNARPTMSNSFSVEFFLNLVQTSIVKMADAELKMDVRDDIKAAIITANINPAKPVKIVTQRLQ